MMPAFPVQGFETAEYRMWTRSAGSIVPSPGSDAGFVLLGKRGASRISWTPAFEAIRLSPRPFFPY